MSNETIRSPMGLTVKSLRASIGDSDSMIPMYDVAHLCFALDSALTAANERVKELEKIREAVINASKCTDPLAQTIMSGYVVQLATGKTDDTEKTIHYCYEIDRSVCGRLKIDSEKWTYDLASATCSECLRIVKTKEHEMKTRMQELESELRNAQTCVSNQAANIKIAMKQSVDSLELYAEANDKIKAMKVELCEKSKHIEQLQSRLSARQPEAKAAEVRSEYVHRAGHDGTLLDPKIICGATDGEFSSLSEIVTCPACRANLHPEPKNPYEKILYCATCGGVNLGAHTNGKPDASGREMQCGSSREVRRCDLPSDHPEYVAKPEPATKPVELKPGMTTQAGDDMETAWGRPADSSSRLP